MPSYELRPPRIIPPRSPSISYCLAIVFLLASLFLCPSTSFAQKKTADRPTPQPAGAAEKKAEKVSIQFVDVELATLTKFISEITGKNFIFDERLRGTISVIAPSKLSVDEAFTLFTSVLELKGFALVPSGVDAYEIVPAQEARQRGILRATEERPRVNESYIARLIPLKYISTDEALKFIQPLVSRDGYISSFIPGKLLLVVDSGLNIAKILSMIQSIDRVSVREEPEIVILKHSSADAVAKILNDGLGRERARAMAGQPMEGEGAVAIPDPRLNGVILLGNKGIRETMKGLIALMDVPAPTAQGRINVYFLENADATELSKVLEGMLKGVGVQPTRAAAPGAAGAPAAPFESAGGITITPDKATNSLVVVASPADYQSLVQILKKLDIRRNQVFVEAMIAEVSIDNLLELGTKWRATVTHNGEPIVIAGVGQVDATTMSQILTGLSGLALGGLGGFYTIPALFGAMGGATGTTTDTTGTGGVAASGTVQYAGYAALFALSEFRSAVNVLSTPQLLTSDNKEAEIMVGENVPFVTGRQTNPQLAASVFTTVERQDVGVRLKITPQITEGDYIKLDIYQEISAVKPESEVLTISVGPTTTKRSTKTSVVVKDGQTVVIGGLMEERTDESVSKVPILGDIPFLGWLFKFKSSSKTKTNLLVFITPHRVKEAKAQGLEEKKAELPEIAPKKPYLEGELLVRFKKGVSPEQARAVIAQKKASIKKFFKYINAYCIQLRVGQSVEEAIKEFAVMPGVEYAEPNFQTKPKG